MFFRGESVKAGAAGWTCRKASLRAIKHFFYIFYQQSTVIFLHCCAMQQDYFVYALNYLLLFITLCPFSILGLCFISYCFSYAAVTQWTGAVTQQWRWLYLHGETNSAFGHAVNKVLFCVNG